MWSCLDRYLTVDGCVEDMVDVQLYVFSAALFCDHPLFSIWAECNRKHLPNSLLRGCEILAENMFHRLVTCRQTLVGIPQLYCLLQGHCHIPALLCHFAEISVAAMIKDASG